MNREERKTSGIPFFLHKPIENRKIKNAPLFEEREHWKDRVLSARFIASLHPRSMSMHKQVSRLSFILLGRLPA